MGVTIRRGLPHRRGSIADGDRRGGTPVTSSSIVMKTHLDGMAGAAPEAPFVATVAVVVIFVLTGTWGFVRLWRSSPHKVAEFEAQNRV